MVGDGEGWLGMSGNGKGQFGTVEDGWGWVGDGRAMVG